MKKLLIYFLFSVPYLHATISSSLLQSKAAACGQKEQWQQAQTHMHQLMIDNPDQADIVYDSGVAAYRLAEFSKAAAYFENVTKLPEVQKDLKKQAHFNLGNTKVALGQLPDAITQYEHVLAMDPENKPAQHNLEKVKEMLKQQQKQNQQQQQKKDQSKNNQQNQDQQSQDQQNQNGDDQQSNNGSDKNKNDSSSNEQSQNNTQESSTGNQEKKQDANSQQNGQQKGESNDKSRQQDRNQQQQQLHDSHDASSEQQKQQQKKQSSKSTAQPIKNGNKEQEMQQGTVEDSQNDAQQHVQEQQFGAHERWMARVLDHQEKADKAAQKALIKTNLNNQLAGRDGQNCW